ncbi:MAG: hypothetical protein D6767_01985, partial [Candidatus Hydrogenedentota bacterium]
DFEYGYWLYSVPIRLLGSLGVGAVTHDLYIRRDNRFENKTTIYAEAAFGMQYPFTQHLSLLSKVYGAYAEFVADNRQKFLYSGVGFEMAVRYSADLTIPLRY